MKTLEAPQKVLIEIPTPFTRPMLEKSSVTKQAKRPNPILITLGIAITCIGLVAVGVIASSETKILAGPTLTDRYVVFVHGLRSPFDCAGRNVKTSIGAETFDDIKNNLKSNPGLKLTEDRFLYYSYAYTSILPEIDTCTDSWQPLERHVATFNRFLEDQIFSKDPKATVTLIGHSLGGTLISYWLGSLDAQHRGNIQAVITLDSPLQGKGLAPLCTKLKLEVVAPVCNDFGPMSQAIKTNLPRAAYLAKVYNVYNKDDYIVLAEDAVLPGKIRSLELSGAQYNGRDAHGVALSHPASLTFIREVVNSNDRLPLWSTLTNGLKLSLQ